MAAAVLVGAGGLTVAGGLPAEAADWPAPIEHPPTVTADRLPTVQVDGVVWDVELVGNTVYAGGQFTTTWPAGATQTQGPRTARSNFLAFDVTTGALRADINFPANAQVRTLELAPDGRTLYVGGDFTSFGGQQRRRIAAINTATNSLTNFAPFVDYHVWTIDATANTVYIGGNFNVVGGQTRTRLAAFTLNGTLLPWAPTADREVQALVVSPDGSQVAVGGRFEVVNGINGRTALPTELRWGRGLVVLAGDTSQSTPAILPFAATDIVRNGGPDGGITTLASDGELLYGGGFTFGRPAGTLEGVFAAEWGSGNVRWVNECHGDTYMVHPQGPVVYAVGHAHYCGNQNGWGQPSGVQDDWIYRRAIGMTKEPAGTTYTERLGYTNFAGQPRPDLLNFFPLVTSGSYTGYFQGAWSVTGDARYLVLGGEFPSVNGTAQRGLVRFAVRSLAPNNEGPRLGGTAWPIKVQSFAAGEATVSWQANEDRDDATLEYRVFRRTGGSGNGTQLHTRTVTAPWWNRHTMHFTDTSANPGATYQYRVLVTDGFDNFSTSPWVSHTVPAGGSGDQHPYTAAVLASSPESWWRLGESAGSATAVDVMGFRDATVNSGVTLGQPGTIAGDTNSAAQFSGTSTGNVISTLFEHPNHVISLEAWFRAPFTANGGLLVGFNNSQTGSGSNTQDRALYMTSDGRVAFGVNPTSGVAVQTPGDYRDDQWHHAVGVLSDDGLQLYVDGVLRASNPNVTNARTGYYGYWRIGAGSTSGLPGGGTGGTSQFEGLIDDVALYKRALPATEVQAHFTAAGQTNEPPPALDTYAQSVVDASPSSYWRLNETSGTFARDTVGLAHGQYAGTGVTQGTPGALQGASDPSVAFTGGDGRVNRVTQATSPTTFSLELWFNTTSTSVGKLIGYGNGTGTANSTTYDRHLYLQADGRLVFGTSRSGATNTTQTQTAQQWRITTANAYNDGQWHHVVAAKSPTTGMQLYVDGVLVGNEPTFTSSRNYTGTWRVGGDTTWATGSGSVTNAPFNGRIDEVAVYGSVVTPAVVQAHYDLGRGNAPNQPPEADIAVTQLAERTFRFDGTGSTDDGDDIVSYSWNFGDGTPAGSGATVQHEFQELGQFTVTLTVTDGRGLQDTAQVTVNVEGPNQAPDAQLEVVSSSFRTIQLSGADSSDIDGTIVSYSWDFGDDETATGPEVNHTYDAAGEYTITLTVTDDDGATDTATTTFTATDPPNQAPVAEIEVVEQDELTVELSGGDSSDGDGTIVSYSWDFGDDETATGPEVSHTYEAAGEYTITLTVTDDDGATDTAQTTVQVEEAPDALAADAFGRNLATGWGTADTGGTWTLSNAASGYAVSGGVGRLTGTVGANRAAYLTNATSGSFDIVADVALDRPATGGGAYASLVGRRVANGTEFRAKLRFLSTGQVQIFLVRVVNHTETTLSSAMVPGVNVGAGDAVRVRFQLSGGASTSLAATVWAAGGTEPASPTVTAVDNGAPAALQGQGHLGVLLYTAGSWTGGAPVLLVDNLMATAG